MDRNTGKTDVSFDLGQVKPCRSASLRSQGSEYLKAHILRK